MTTVRGDTVFLHVLDWKDPVLAITGLDRKIRSASYVGREGRPSVTPIVGGAVLGIESPAATEPDLVIELILEPVHR